MVRWYTHPFEKLCFYTIFLPTQYVKAGQTSIKLLLLVCLCRRPQKRALTLKNTLGNKKVAWQAAVTATRFYGETYYFL